MQQPPHRKPGNASPAAKAPSQPRFVQGEKRRYRLLGPLGNGGMGRVFAAQVEGIGSRVAIKVLHRSDALDAQEQRLRFLREAEILTQLRHPNIVRMLDFTEDDEGRLYLVMELVGGESLRDVLLIEGHLPEPRLVGIARQIADALGEAHHNGIIHRDLKPANVHVVRDDTGHEHVVVLDFGLGKQLDEDTGQQLTGLGRYIGSMPYSSPEQLLTSPLDGRSDIYSLGIFMFEMATGLLPFSANAPMDLIDMHLHREVPSFRTVFPACSVSGRTEAIVRKCLAKAPESRWQSADELLAELTSSWPEEPTRPR